MQKSGMVNPPGEVEEGFSEGVSFYPDQPWLLSSSWEDIFNLFLHCSHQFQTEHLYPTEHRSSKATLLNDIAFTMWNGTYFHASLKGWIEAPPSDISATPPTLLQRNKVLDKTEGQGHHGEEYRQGQAQCSKEEQRFIEKGARNSERRGWRERWTGRLQSGPEESWSHTQASDVFHQCSVVVLLTF